MPSYVIVGASQGLGYEWLRQLSSSHTNTVIGLARTPANVEKRLAADSITNVHILQADMADNKSLIAAAAETAKLTGGAVDYLIINGVHVNPEENFMTPTEFTGKEDLLTEAMTQSLKVNVIGVVFTINAFLPLVRKSGIKKITAISTGLADRDYVEKGSMSFALTYSAMKAALNIVVAKYAAELKSEGIVLLALSPGFVDTSGDKPERSLTPKQLQRVGVMLGDFREQYPAFAGAITPSESVGMQKKVIEDITIDNTGAFLSHHGNKAWL